jgi:hypothetical protein
MATPSQEAAVPWLDAEAYAQPALGASEPLAAPQPDGEAPSALEAELEAQHVAALEGAAMPDGQKADMPEYPEIDA